MSTDTPHYDMLPGFTPSSILGPHSAAEYWELPEGEPVELLYGRYVVSPSPLEIHQTISALLSELLLRLARTEGGKTFAAPMDVILAEHSIVQPDLLYIAKARRNIVKGRVHGAPDLVIEILSEQHVRRDRVDKLNLYAEHGVAEYWIVDPEAKQFDFLIHRDGRYEIQPQKDDFYQSPLIKALSINLAEFWGEVTRHVGEESKS